jgi:hypothetical protein
LLKEQELSGGGGGGREERVSQDDSGIGVGTSLEVLAGLATTTPSPTTFAQLGEEGSRGFEGSASLAAGPGHQQEKEGGALPLASQS